MTTVSEEAIQAAADAWHADIAQGGNDPMKAALVAAHPYIIDEARRSILDHHDMTIVKAERERMEAEFDGMLKVAHDLHRIARDDAIAAALTADRERIAAVIAAAGNHSDRDWRDGDYENGLRQGYAEAADIVRSWGLKPTPDSE